MIHFETILIPYYTTIRLMLSVESHDFSDFVIGRASIVSILRTKRLDTMRSLLTYTPSLI